MGKTAFIFPGQGSQYIGMGEDFVKEYAVSGEVYRVAQEASGLDVAALCFKDNEKINITEYTQIAMLTAQIAMLKAVEEAGLKADAAAGLSLGEYAALAVGGVMDLKDLFYCIRQRGIFMQEAVPVGGAMTAVLGLDSEKIERICEETEGCVTVANYNCPGQTVITGEKEAVDRAASKLQEEGARRCVPLKVSGPFHSPLLTGAGEKLAGVLKDIEIGQIGVPYVSNVTADYVTETEAVKDLLVKQVYSPVKWQQSVERLIADGVDTFVEIGPGKTLSGFMRKISRDVRMYSIEKAEDIARICESI